MSSAHVLAGEERLAVLPALGRPIRQGAPQALLTSDAERVREAIAARDRARATAYLDLVGALHDGMALIYADWILAYPAVLAAHLPGDEVAATMAAAVESYREAVAGIAELADQEGTRLVGELFSATRLTPQASERFRAELASGTPAIVTELMALPHAHLQEARLALEHGEHEGARAHFDAYFAAFHARHEGCVELTSALPATIVARHGQPMAETVIVESLRSGIGYGGLWALTERLSPAELAAFTAEHLRAHLSGAARDGAVEIVEEPDRYRLVLAPCGSGGAMRRRGVPSGTAGSRPLPGASALTWGRAGEVPACCAHCAFNEQESIRRFGYPVFVTEFDPDPARPCGWTVYKDPEAIPERYFTRLGVTRDPSRFRRLPLPTVPASER